MVTTYISIHNVHAMHANVCYKNPLKINYAKNKKNKKL